MEYNLMDIGNEDDSLEQNEHELLLLNLNDDLLMESIEEQIKNPSMSFYERTNYVEIFETRYKYIIERFVETPDLIQEVKETRHSFYLKVFNLLSERYKLELDDPSNDVNMYIITGVIYEFFVLDYTEHVKEFVIQFIINNKKSLAQQFYTKNKRVETVTLRKSIKNPDDVVILSSMHKIIDNIVSLDINTETIIRTITQVDEAEFNNYIIREHFLENKTIVSEEFPKIFFDILNRENDNFMRMVNEIQLEYLKIIR